MGEKALGNASTWASKIGFFVSLTVLQFIAHTSYSETSQPRVKGRPKIGLVLAGGGALGFAHVGVLRVLEENRVPVDLVTGTSMGSIVGAAYASGVKLDEMEDLLAHTDWDGLFSEDGKRQSQPFRFKPGRNREIYGDIKIGFRKGSIVVPTGVVQGQNVLPLLQRLYQRTKNPVDFDTLPLPFRAVTADLETGQAVIPKSGDLATIVRASMSVPGFFAPIELDGKLLVDGGIVNNLPVDVAQSMGADILIVVELYADLSKKDQLGSPLSVTGQIISLLLAQNSALQRQLMKPEDILIAPELKGFSATDFPKGDAIKARGIDAAGLVIEQLKKLSISPEAYAEYQQARTGGPSQSLPPTVDFVRLDNQSTYPEHRILEQLQLKSGDSFDRAKVEEGIKKLYDTGQFQEVTYSTTETEKGKGIIIRTKEKEYLKKYLRLGAAFEDDFDGDSTYRLGAAYRITDFEINGTYVDFQGEIGRNPRLATEWYQPLSSEVPYFFAPSASIGRSELQLRRDGDEIARYHRSTGNLGLSGGRELGTIGEFRVSYTRGFGDLERDIGDPELPEFGYDVADVKAGIDIDGLDEPDFPTKGVLAQAGYSSSVEELGASDSFNSAAGVLTVPYTWGKNTLTFRGDYNYTFEDRPIERSLSVGGFFDLPGYQQSSLLASDLAISRLLYYRRFSEMKTPLFGFKLFGGGSVNFASLRSDVEAVRDNHDIWSGLLFVGADTPLLPTYFGVGFAEEGENAIYLAIGRIGVAERN